MDDKDNKYQLAPDLVIHRIINGMWQVAGGHGYIDHELAIEEMIRYHENGFTSWDLADIYGPAEDFIGQFRTRLLDIKGKKEPDRIQALTKWVPQPQIITPSFTKESIEKSITRMHVNSIDLLQFHWWDYNNRSYIDAIRYLSDLVDNGAIKHIGLTNFDTEHTQTIIDLGLPIISNQVQYSVIDRRPEIKMLPYYSKHNIKLLAYGSLCGGLLSERYLGAAQEPSASDLDTLSLRKYKKMIDRWGGWNLFQELLSTLNEIAKKYDVNIANVATKYILDKPSVAGVIIGSRLGISEHRNSNTQVFNFSMDRSDYDTIESVCGKSNDLFETIGDCGDEYRL